MGDDRDFPKLAAFLEKRLPEIGLEYDTYGPYVIGMDVELGDDGTISEDDGETINGIMELLQASSESHADDEQVWKDLCVGVIENLQEDVRAKRQQKDDEIQRQKEELEAKLEQAKKEEREQPVKEPQKRSVDDAAKKELLKRFAYEQDGDEDEEAEPVQTNKEVAAAGNLERARELRSKNTHTKKEEQQKTKENRKNKEHLKEERKKRATKGERKR